MTPNQYRVLAQLVEAHRNQGANGPWMSVAANDRIHAIQLCGAGFAIRRAAPNDHLFRALANGRQFIKNNPNNPP